MRQECANGMRQRKSPPPALLCYTCSGANLPVLSGKEVTMYHETTREGTHKFTQTYKGKDGRTRKASVTLKAYAPDDAARALAAKIRKKREEGDAVEEENKQKQTGPAETNHPRTLADLCALYVAYEARIYRPQTVANLTEHLNGLLRILGRETPIEDVSAGFVRSRLLAYDRTATTRNEHMRRVKQLWRWAYSFDYVEGIDWLAKLTPEKDEAKTLRHSVKYLDTDELRAVLAACTLTHWRLLIRFLALSGLRVGEAAALTWNDIREDDGRQYLSVSKTYSWMIRQTCPAPKTDASNRRVCVRPELADALKCQREFSMACGRKCTPDQLVFFDRTGSTFSLRAFEAYFRRLTRLTIGRELTPHALRHTFAALMAGAGVPLDVIARQLGHADSRVTREVYFHVTNGLREADAETLSDVVLLHTPAQ